MGRIFRAANIGIFRPFPSENGSSNLANPFQATATKVIERRHCGAEMSKYKQTYDAP